MAKAADLSSQNVGVKPLCFVASYRRPSLDLYEVRPLNDNVDECVEEQKRTRSLSLNEGFVFAIGKFITSKGIYQL